MDSNNKIDLEDLGYSPFFESERVKLGLSGQPVARVFAQHKGSYTVRTPEKSYYAKITGKQIFEAASKEELPAVGDWVAISILNDEQASIRAILPRKTILKRKRGNKDGTQVIASNIDEAFIVEAVDRDYNLNRFERYLALAEEGGVKPVVVLNKTDLLSPADLERILAELNHRFPGTDIVTTSVVSREGLDALGGLIHKGKTYCFLGSSGVGKSSLTNQLLGEQSIQTEEIGSRSGRGKHVTTARQMYFLDKGGIIIDNPGMREVGIADASRGVEGSFDEISELGRNCKYNDCTHTQEPGCVVINAVNEGKLDGQKYANYLSLRKESAYHEMGDREKKEKDRRFGKFMKNTKKDLKKFGIKDY